MVRIKDTKRKNTGQRPAREQLTKKQARRAAPGDDTRWVISHRDSYRKDSEQAISGILDLKQYPLVSTNALETRCLVDYIAQGNKPAGTQWEFLDCLNAVSFPTILELFLEFKASNKLKSQLCARCGCTIPFVHCECGCVLGKQGYVCIYDRKVC